MKIAIIGSGYVGLVTGSCLAELGHEVLCIDNDVKKINMLKKLKIPIYEANLDELVIKNYKKKRLSFSSKIQDGVKFAKVIFICVGTPPRPNGESDLTSIEFVAREIATYMDSYRVIVEKSTVPVETGKKIKQTIQRYNTKGVEFDVVSNPEFLREGNAVYDFIHPDRIVIGVETKRAENIIKEIYQPLKSKILVTDIESAELIKHASNSFLAMKISFINAVSRICEKVGADIKKVAEGIGIDRRIGNLFLDAGIGFGGSCFPKDVSAFIKISEKNGYDFKLLKEVQNINNEQKKFFITKIHDAVWSLNEKTIGVLGLSFKPNTDDIREAPSIEIISTLISENAYVKAYDPKAIKNFSKIFKDSKIKYYFNPYEVAKDADVLLILTEWDEFKNLDLKKIKKIMKTPIIVDGRNIFDLETMKELGFTYYSIGRKPVS